MYIIYNNMTEAIFTASYPYIYATFVKQRWRDKSLLYILEREFSDFDTAYFASALRTGLI